MTPLLLHRAVRFFVTIYAFIPPSYSLGENHYCGVDWVSAAQSCATACPSTNDAECPDGEACHSYTGCADKVSVAVGSPPAPGTAPSGSAEVGEGGDSLGTPKPSKNPVRTRRPTPPSPPLTMSNAPTTTVAPTVGPSVLHPLTAQPASGTPSLSPIVRPYLGRIDANDHWDNNGESTASQRSYGVIFDLQTTPESPAIEILNIEFYSPVQGANVAYEVWTKEGTWHGSEGREREFELVAKGNVTTWSSPSAPTQLRQEEAGANIIGSGDDGFDDKRVGELTRIPPQVFVPIRMDGGGARQSIYLTLSSKQLLYARSSTSEEPLAVTSIEEVNRPTMDAIVMKRTPELIVYEGAAVMTYPFNRADQRMYYRLPRRFLGRIWYHRNPCNEIHVSNEDGTINETLVKRNPTKWDECVDLKESERLPDVNELPPFFEDDSGTNNEGFSNEALPKTFNGTVPASSPTTSSVPTINTMKVNLILTLRNVASNRILTGKEQDAISRITKGFYEEQELLELNEVELYQVDVWYQQVFLEPIMITMAEDEDGSQNRFLLLDDRNSTSSTSSNRGRSPKANDRLLQQVEGDTLDLEVYFTRPFEGGAHFSDLELDAADKSVFVRQGGNGDLEGGINILQQGGDDSGDEITTSASHTSIGIDTEAYSPDTLDGVYSSPLTNGGGSKNTTDSTHFPNSDMDGIVVGMSSESGAVNLGGGSGDTANQLIPDAPTEESMNEAMLDSEKESIFSGREGPQLQQPTTITEEGLESETEVPSVKSLEITLVISILYSPLPRQITQELLQTLLMNNEESFMELLKYSYPLLSDLSSYFRTLDSIPSVLAVDRVTLSPTYQPTGSPTPYVSEPPGEGYSILSGSMLAVTIFGLLYVLLAACSICYVKRARRDMHIEQQKRLMGGDRSATTTVGHGMTYEGHEIKKNKKNDYDENGDLHKSGHGGRITLDGGSLLHRSFKGSLMSSFGKKNRVVSDSSTMAEKVTVQYRDMNNSGHDEENNRDDSYYSEEEADEEEMSSMEDSYYSKDDSDCSSEGSYYSED